MANLPADVQVYYVEEIVDLCPSCVVYLHQGEQYYNTDRVFDTMVAALDAETPELRSFTKQLQSVVAEGERSGFLTANCLNVRPALAARNRSYVILFVHQLNFKK